MTAPEPQRAGTPVHRHLRPVPDKAEQPAPTPTPPVPVLVREEWVLPDLMWLGIWGPMGSGALALVVEPLIGKLAALVLVGVLIVTSVVLCIASLRADR
jgi:hypothetical protein